MVKEEQRKKRHEKYEKEKTKWHTNPSTSISIITLNMNGFNKAIPKQTLSKWRKSRSNCMLSTGNTLQIQRQKQIESKIIEKVCKYHSVQHHTRGFRQLCKKKK